MSQDDDLTSRPWWWNLLTPEARRELEAGGPVENASEPTETERARLETEVQQASRAATEFAQRLTGIEDRLNAAVWLLSHEPSTDSPGRARWEKRRNNLLALVNAEKP